MNRELICVGIKCSLHELLVAFFVNYQYPFCLCLWLLLMGFCFSEFTHFSRYWRKSLRIVHREIWSLKSVICVNAFNLEEAICCRLKSTEVSLVLPILSLLSNHNHIFNCSWASVVSPLRFTTHDNSNSNSFATVLYVFLDTWLE